MAAAAADNLAGTGTPLLSQAPAEVRVQVALESAHRALDRFDPDAAQRAVQVAAALNPAPPMAEQIARLLATIAVRRQRLASANPEVLRREVMGRVLAMAQACCHDTPFAGVGTEVPIELSIQPGGPGNPARVRGTPHGQGDHRGVGQCLERRGPAYFASFPQKTHVTLIFRDD